MSFRYKGARLSNTAPVGYITGLWTMRQQLQANTGGGSGSQYFQTAGTFSFVAPAGVTSVCVVCIGPTLQWANNSYYGRGGGGLGWKNNIAVTPGSSYTVVVGDSNTGNDSYFISTGTVKGGAAQDPSTGGGYVGDGGGNGGNGGDNTGSGSGAGGGGAGGYAGNGGRGGDRGANSGFNAATSSGGGGGGAGGTSGSFGAGGGGVSVYGIGTTGAGGTYSAASSDPISSGVGGSYGNDGSPSNTGGAYGAASKGGGLAGTGASVSGGGYAGAVRVVWGGLTFPSNAV
jgi:hypothetical protein